MRVDRLWPGGFRRSTLGFSMVGAGALQGTRSVGARIQLLAGLLLAGLVAAACGGGRARPVVVRGQVRLTSPVASDQAPTTPASLLVRRQGSQAASRIEVPAGGRFRLVEPPGAYRLVLAGVEGCQATLRLVAGAPARVTLGCDPAQAAGGPAGVVRSAAVPASCPPMLQAYDAGRAVGLSSCAGEVGLAPVARGVVSG
jgi:hypothetical protein